MANHNYTVEKADRLVKKERDLITFGRSFRYNPVSIIPESGFFWIWSNNMIVGVGYCLANQVWDPSFGQYSRQNCPLWGRTKPRVKTIMNWPSAIN